MNQLPKFEDKRNATIRRLTHKLPGNYNISDMKLKELVSVAFDSGVLAGVSACYELQQTGADVRECIK